MLEILSSKRMTIVIVILIIVCTIVVIIEEWFANSQLVISSSLSGNSIISNDLLQDKLQFSTANSSLHEAKPKSISAKEQLKQLEQEQQSQLPELTDWKQFLNFLSLVGLFGGLSGLLVRYRQLQIRYNSLARFRKSSENKTSKSTADPANCTLIELNFSN